MLLGQIRLAREIALGLANRKFQLIHNLVSRPDNRLKIVHLCKLAHVTRSGYYNWLSNMEFRNAKEQKDREDFSIILEAYKFKGYDKGIRGIHMRLLHLEKPVLMNLKKIRRLMVKYNLRCPIRKPNPYRQIVRALRTNKVAPNLLNREFKEHGPRKVLLTDITYIPLNDKYCYLSTILDSYTMQVLGYCLSDSLAIDFVLESVNMVLARHGSELSSETIIHSDQGSHYTSYKFIHLVNDANLRQSMSRRGNCWDNAPQESFYGHMKDEIHISECKDFESLRLEIDSWMDYYNNYRYQWKLAKLSPNEYYEYIKTGIYPLKII